jgi:hypothetical protein
MFQNNHRNHVKSLAINRKTLMLTISSKSFLPGFMRLRCTVKLYCLCGEVQLNMAVRYSLCTVLLTVPLAEMKVKFVAELVSVTELTLTNHTEFKKLCC